MSPIGEAHTAFATAALVLGAWNASRPKGTGMHRLVGHAYYVAMLGVNGTAFMIYEVFGTFGPFHALALVSLLTLFAAMVPALLRRPRDRWRHWHAYFMLYSYVGLVAAAAAEAGVRLPPIWSTDHANLYFALAAGLPTVAVTIIGIGVVPMIVARNLRVAGG